MAPGVAVLEVVVLEAAAVVLEVLVTEAVVEAVALEVLVLEVLQDPLQDRPLPEVLQEEALALEEAFVLLAADHSPVVDHLLVVEEEEDNKTKQFRNILKKLENEKVFNFHNGIAMYCC